MYLNEVLIKNVLELGNSDVNLKIIYMLLNNKLLISPTKYVFKLKILSKLR